MENYFRLHKLSELFCKAAKLAKLKGNNHLSDCFIAKANKYFYLYADKNIHN